MSTRINTNVASLNAHRQVLGNHKSMSKSLERLGSGLKINRGVDAPAQLQISEQLRAQSAGLRQAIDNTEMGVSLMQTAEAALDEVSRTLVNARQIAVHAANECMKIFGSYGYSTEYPAERLYRDAKSLQVVEGTSNVQKLIIAGIASGHVANR